MSAGICKDCYRAVEAHHPGYWPKNDPVRHRLQLVLIEKIGELVREYIAEIRALNAALEAARA